MVSRLLHGGGQRVCAAASKVKLLLNMLDPMRSFFCARLAAPGSSSPMMRLGALERAGPILFRINSLKTG